jgi:hypothetical protein
LRGGVAGCDAAGPVTGSSGARWSRLDDVSARRPLMGIAAGRRARRLVGGGGERRERARVEVWMWRTVCDGVEAVSQPRNPAVRAGAKRGWTVVIALSGLFGRGVLWCSSGAPVDVGVTTRRAPAGGHVADHRDSVIAGMRGTLLL